MSPLWPNLRYLAARPGEVLARHGAPEDEVEPAPHFSGVEVRVMNNGEARNSGSLSLG